MRRPLVLGCVFFTVILALLMQLHPPWWEKEQVLPEYEATIQGILVEKEYKLSQDKLVLTLTLDQCVLLPEGQELSCKLLCYGETKCETVGEMASLEEKLGERIALGNRITLRGKLRNFEAATNPGQFDARRYYQILEIGGRVYSCKLLSGTGNETPKDMSLDELKESLYQIKRYASLLFYRVLPKENASLMCSLLLGQKNLLDTEVKDLYQQSGIIHILAISGLHISLLGMAFYHILRNLRMPIPVCTVVSTGVVVLYGGMVGFGPSSFRAIVMFSLQMCACLLGRTYDMLTGISLAAFLTLAGQPLYLYHSGFLLSFCSVLSIALLVVGLEGLFPSRLTPGIAILLGTLPVQAAFYHQISPYSLLLNLLVVPLVGILVVCGILILFFGLISPTLAGLPGMLGGLLFRLFEKAGAFTLSLPGKRWILGKPSIYQLLLYLTVLVITILIGKKLPNLWCLFCFCLMIGILAKDWQSGLQLTALDVGQGDGFYVTDHRKTHILVDGGSSTVKGVGGYRILPYLKSQGCSYLDGVFISHLDEDHYNGILELMEVSKEEGIPIKCIYISTGEQDEKKEELQEIAETHGIAVREIYAGDVYQKGDIRVECLYPTADSGGTDTNENSMTLLLEYKSFRALFTGDLEGTGEYLVTSKLEQREDWKGVSLLKVAHHGSRNSTGDSFLQVVQPETAIISSSPKGRYGHPHRETLERLAKWNTRIFRTDEGGAITIWVKRGKMYAEQFTE